MSALEEYPYPELYRVIGEHPEASREQIEDAYFRQLAAHRDWPERMHAIGAAGTVLLDRELRRAYDRQRPRPAERPKDQHLRRLARWGLGYLGGLIAVWALMRPAGLGPLLLMAHLLTCAPTGWRALRRPLRWLELGGWWGLCLRLPGSVVVGAVLLPVELAQAVVAVSRQAAAGELRGPGWRALHRLQRSIKVPIPRRRGST